MAKMEFSELVNLESLKTMAESLFQASGIPVGIIGVDGTIHVQSGWQDICMKYHRIHPHTCNRCLESDKYITGDLQEGMYKEYKCLNGLWDVGVPLVIEGEHLATIFLGQFFYEDEEIHLEFYRSQAAAFGFDEQGYMDALAKVPRFSRSKVRHIITYYLELVRTLAENGLSQIKLKESKKAFAVSQKYLDTIFHSVNESIFIHDFTGKIIFFNKTATEMFGYESSELSELHLNDIISENSPVKGKILYDIIDSAKSNGPTVLECICTGKGGREFWVEVNLSAVVFGDKEEIIATVRDVTDRKLNEILMLQEAQEMETLRTEFFANISHELRTPLNIIFGAIQIMELEAAIVDKPIDRMRLINNLAVGKQNCHRLLRLINNLIDSTKLDAGYYELCMTNCNVVSTVEEITLSVAQYIQSKDISLTFDTEVEERYIACDLDKLERILLNLLSNAVKFTPAGGDIFVNVADGEEFISITVQDTGIGIPDSKQKIIFDRFRQVDKSLARKHEGSGIGLSLVKSLLELQGGSISVESKLGHGTKFVVKLPVRMPAEQDEESMVESACTCSLENGEDKYIERIKIEFSDIYN